MSLLTLVITTAGIPRGIPSAKWGRLRGNKPRKDSTAQLSHASFQGSCPSGQFLSPASGGGVACLSNAACTVWTQVQSLVHVGKLCSLSPITFLQYLPHQEDAHPQMSFFIFGTMSKNKDYNQPMFSKGVWRIPVLLSHEGLQSPVFYQEGPSPSLLAIYSFIFVYINPLA